MRNYFSLGHITAGFIAMMVGFTSSVVLVFQAATMAGANTAQMSSWLFALGLGIALSAIVLSLYFRMPILVGWSTPGAAFLASSCVGFSLAEATGAFMVAAGLTFLSGVTGIVEKSMKYIPRALASAMIAGILFPVCIKVFSALEQQQLLVGGMLLTYLFAKTAWPRIVLILVLVMGVALANLEGLIHFPKMSLQWPQPIFISPAFTWSAFFNLGLPLFLVTMTSQNIPGISVLRSSGYQPHTSTLMSVTGFINFIFAPLGCFGINLAALTAAICAGEAADANPAERYKATIFAGFCWIGVGLLGSSIVLAFSAFPQALILALAGIALIGTIGHQLKAALEDEAHREAAVLTILISASGIHLFGIGSAFWGLFLGLFSSMVLNGFKKERLINMSTT